MIADHTALLGLLGLAGLLAAVLVHVYQLVCASPLAAVPGPRLFALTPWRLALEDWRGTRTRCLRDLHAQYGPAVRIGPRAVSFASLPALRTVYGAGSGFERTAFYRMFDVYGRQNLFTFAPSRQHAERKKLVSHAYAKTALLRADGLAAPLVADKVRAFLALIEASGISGASGASGTCETDVFLALHWFSLDVITGFLYGARVPGGTDALRGCAADRRLLDDIVHPARRRLSWCAVHFPRATAWLYGRTGLAEQAVTRLGLLPMPKPATYTAIRVHARRAWEAFAAGGRRDGHDEAKTGPAASIMDRLAQHATPLGGLDGLDVASELADHLLAGIDTTSDTVLFALWVLSRPEHAHYQARLRAEVAALAGDALDAHGLPTPDAAAHRLPFLDAVLHETLRLFAPLPASEPRVLPADAHARGGTAVVVDGIAIGPGTTVSMDPYTLHRNAAVFADPLAFRPERWLGEGNLGDVAEMRRWFWAFSSGARMCIGMHLAMVEMTMLLSAIYRRYATSLPPRQQGVSPGIVSRFEVFSDSTFSRVSEHECWITFARAE